MKSPIPHTEQSFFVGLMGASKNIQRWSLLPQFQTEYLAQHCFDVAVIGHLLGAIAVDVFNEDVCPDKIAALCVFHDAAESAGLSDPPSVAKRIDPETKALYQQLERKFETVLLNTLPEALKPRYAPLICQSKSNRHGQLVKAADIISAYQKCAGELSKGNEAFSMAMEDTKSTLEAMAAKDEVCAYYCAHFLELANEPFDHLAKLQQRNDV
ncbi:5'-deoxynucleotidase [Alteromonas sp.]|uniref:5'-deoxynucleotidase n=1 Tax=Alteromonas sp. TaxID=232 RepID=UPI000C6BB25D|nr:5'-deoxynucleotidase [Alteromonas sp.]MAI36463.1 5'-deoxynucleotidase [Alteromonas sp.]|tara:strand:- start:6148 stop:6783 length:636 start_codon:yes stop_codon:yes gene_type:complete